MDTRVKPAYDAGKLSLAINTMWRATILTLFPGMFPGPLGASLAGRALANGVWEMEVRDIRDAATDKHRSVDDTPAGSSFRMTS
jgi:tRNA (guanine37-N1)-methyltransferase